MWETCFPTWETSWASDKNRGNPLELKQISLKPSKVAIFGADSPTWNDWSQGGSSTPRRKVAGTHGQEISAPSSLGVLALNWLADPCLESGNIRGRTGKMTCKLNEQAEYHENHPHRSWASKRRGMTTKLSFRPLKQSFKAPKLSFKAMKLRGRVPKPAQMAKNPGFLTIQPKNTKNGYAGPNSSPCHPPRAA